MMRKKGTKRFDSSEVQGDGSYVEMRKPRWKGLKQSLPAFQDAGGQNNPAVAGLTMLDSMMPNMIVEWNWTDEDGEPLPLPKNDPTVLDELETDEAIFLFECANGLLPEFNKKNLGTPR